MNSDELILVLTELRALREQIREDIINIKLEFKDELTELREQFREEMNCINKEITKDIDDIKKDISTFRSFKSAVTTLVSFFVLILSVLAKLFSGVIIKFFKW